MSLSRGLCVAVASRSILSSLVWGSRRVRCYVCACHPLLLCAYCRVSMSTTADHDPRFSFASNTADVPRESECRVSLGVLAATLRVVPRARCVLTFTTLLSIRRAATNVYLVCVHPAKAQGARPKVRSGAPASQRRGEELRHPHFHTAHRQWRVGRRRAGHSARLRHTAASSHLPSHSWSRP